MQPFIKEVMHISAGSGPLRDLMIYNTPAAQYNLLNISESAIRNLSWQMLAILGTMPALHWGCITYSQLHLASGCLPSTCSMLHDCCNEHSQSHRRVDTILRLQEALQQDRWALPPEDFLSHHTMSSDDNVRTGSKSSHIWLLGGTPTERSSDNE